LPGQVKELAEKLGRGEEDIAKSIQELFVKGLVFPSFKTDPPSYRMGRDMIQFHDATILWPEAPREFLDLWQEWTDVEWPKMAEDFSKVMPRPGMRVIPVGVSFRPEGQVLAYEDVKDIIGNARELAVVKCTCRLAAQNCDRSLEVCLQVNNAAAYAVARGVGRKLTKDEALAVMRQAEEEGLIHTTFNQRSVDHVICNCCGDCCQFLPVLIKYGTNVVEPSRFLATVDAELCDACETCVERCYFGAIEVDDTAVISTEKCLGCGLCQVACPNEAIALKEIREKDYVPEKLF
jgi:Na+-translocating ferredoxin:NAD+ oxidoreductase RNF subunit RnfB